MAGPDEGVDVQALELHGGGEGGLLHWNVGFRKYLIIYCDYGRFSFYSFWQLVNCDVRKLDDRAIAKSGFIFTNLIPEL